MIVLFQSTSTLPEHMALSLNMLVMLPWIMSACGIFSIVSSFITIIFIVICNKIGQGKEKKIAAEEKLRGEQAFFIKQLDIEYSKVPVKDNNINELKNDLNNVENCLLNSTWACHVKHSQKHTGFLLTWIIFHLFTPLKFNSDWTMSNLFLTAGEPF